MSATRVLVTGANGQVGVDVDDVLRGATPLGGDVSFQPDDLAVGEGEFEVLGLTHHDLDVTDRDAVVRALRATRPAVVIHLAAYTAVDRAESDAERCYLVNEFGTANVSLAANDVGAHLIAVSTQSLIHIYPRGARDHVSRSPVDHASVRGFRHGRGDERAL